MTNIRRKSEIVLFNGEPKLIMSTMKQEIDNPSTLESRLIRKVRISTIDGELLYAFPDGNFKTSSYAKRIVTLPICYENFFILAIKETTTFSDSKQIDYRYKAISYKGCLLDSVSGRWKDDKEKISEYNQLASLARRQRQFEEYGDWQ